MSNVAHPQVMLCTHHMLRTQVLSRQGLTLQSLTLLLKKQVTAICLFHTCPTLPSSTIIPHIALIHYSPSAALTLSFLLHHFTAISRKGPLPLPFSKSAMRVANCLGMPPVCSKLPRDACSKLPRDAPEAICYTHRAFRKRQPPRLPRDAPGLSPERSLL